MLKIEDLAVGEGPEARDGDRVVLHYTGTLADGTKFDSSKDRGEPFPIQIGRTRLIEGFTLGVVGMKAGGTRRITIPSAMGYGDRGAPPTIPGGATIIFEIDMLEIFPA